MLPCNVVVWETDEGKATVAAFNPMEAFPTDASPTLKELADEVSGPEDGPRPTLSADRFRRRSTWANGGVVPLCISCAVSRLRANGGP